MFQKQPGSGQPTVIARGVTLEGTFQSHGDVIVEGNVQGVLSTKGVLTIGAESAIKADVKATEAQVSGSIEGNVTVVNRLELKSTARIIGDVSAQIIAVEPGAILQGRLSVGIKTAEATIKTPARGVMRVAES